MEIVVGTLVLFFTSFIWFNEHTFFPIWWRLMKKTETPGGGLAMPVLFGAAFVACLVQAFTLSVLFSWKGDVSVVQGFLIGAAVAFGLGAMPAMGHRTFAGDGFKVWAIEVGADITGLALAGAVMAALI